MAGYSFTVSLPPPHRVPVILSIFMEISTASSSSTLTTTAVWYIVVIVVGNYYRQRGNK